jgi:hypothetical protein
MDFSMLDVRKEALMRNVEERSTVAQIVGYAVESALHGESRAYLKAAAKREKVMRDMFGSFRASAAQAAFDVGGYDALRYLNGFYNTMYPLVKLREVSAIMCETVAATGWWTTEPPNIMRCSGTESQRIASFVPGLLERISDAGLDHPHSLLTKWLHFCFPDSFVIYDSRAACSVQMWSYFTYPIGAGEQFSANVIGRSDGSGYRGMLLFYQMCWELTTEDERAHLGKAAQTLSEEIDSAVGVIDVMDKMLWLANGDPRKMGLIRPQGE